MSPSAFFRDWKSKTHFVIEKATPKRNGQVVSKKSRKPRPTFQRTGRGADFACAFPYNARKSYSASSGARGTYSSRSPT